MKKPEQSGFTLPELIVMVVVVVFLALFLDSTVCGTSAIEQAASSAMKNKGRGIWKAVLTANAERELFGLPSVWPKDLGFDASRTSTEYFRMLIQPETMCENLKPGIFGGGGVPVADSVSSFSSANNAWNVICVSTQTPNNETNSLGVPFLITRNVTMGRQVNALSPLTFDKRSPFKKPPFRNQRCVYVTVDGGCFDRRKEYLSLPSGWSAVLEGMGTNTVYDVMFP